MSIRLSPALFPRAVALAAVALTGCLSTAHSIPKNDLQQIAQQPAEQRGRRVRIIQADDGDEPRRVQPAQPTTVVVVEHHDHHDHDHDHDHRDDDEDADNAAVRAAGWLAAAGIGTVALVTTEGIRYDGWADLDPAQPVHLYGPNNEYAQVPLAELTPEKAAWADKAFVKSDEGAWMNAKRAPLDRAGWTYSLLLGAAQIPSGQEAAAGVADTADPGFLGHIQLGRYFNQNVGLLLDFGLGWRDTAFDNTVFEARNALELQVMPFELGRFHAGGYGQVGLGLRAEDRSDGPFARKGFIGGAGGLAQLEITTRMALTARVGYTRIFGEDTAEAMVGISIY